MKLCTACRTYHPESHFDPASPDFPARDGLQFTCRASLADRDWKLRRLPNGRVEIIKKQDE